MDSIGGRAEVRSAPGIGTEVRLWSSATMSAEPPAVIRVVLADDHAVVRSGLRAELGDGFDVVGEADDAEGAIDVDRGPAT